VRRCRTGARQSGAACPFIEPPDEPFRLGSEPARLGRVGRDDSGRSTALHVDRFWLCRSAAPFFLLFVDPPRAIQLVIIISTALSFVALPGLWRAIAPGLLLRLGLGSLAGLPLGLVAFRYADPVVVRVLVGATILAFAVLLGWWRRRGAGEFSGSFGMKPGIEIATGLVAGVATASWGWQGRQC
jgi:hypothetical protein